MDPKCIQCIPFASRMHREPSDAGEWLRALFQPIADEGAWEGFQAADEAVRGFL